MQNRQGTEAGPTGSPGERGRRRPWAGTIVLAVLPLVLVVAGYYRPILLGARGWPISGDAGFYAYQLARVGELGGRWWELGRDELVGAPYQPEFGKHPGVYEGVDLLMVSTLTSRWLDPVINYHVMMMLVLVVNGWVIGWLVRRLTESWRWAALGVVLVTWNYSTAFRLQGHAHLFKYGWTVLAVLAFSRYLDEPRPRRGLILGLAMALVLQASFYLGSFLGMACGVWWLGCLIAGKLGRDHVRAAVVSAVTFMLGGLALTFPVWSPSRSKLLADAYQGHGRIDAWNLSAEPWQYFLAPDSQLAASYVEEFRSRFHIDRGALEGWHYPGWTILLAVAVDLVCRLRGWRLPVTDPRLLDRFMGLSGLLVLFSLAGGPSFFVVSALGCFRAYGRAGLLALALWCVAAPVTLQAALRCRPSGRLRRLGFLCLLALSLYEGHQATAWYPWDRRMEIPAWVDWLARQPQEVRLAAFPPARERPLDWWGYEPLLYRVLHGHACLNGSDSLLFEADLKLLGASFEKMNPAGLRFVVSLGYDHLAFHGGYLAAHPWIASLPWLEPIETRGPWSFYRANDRLERFPRASLERLLASWSSLQVAPEVPVGCWITGRFDLDRDVVVGGSAPIWLAWLDDRGRPVGEPTPALFQHLYGPNIPAFSVKTPRAPGEYQLAVLDHERHRLLSRPYRLRGDLSTATERIMSRPDRFRTSSLMLAAPPIGDCSWDLILVNRSPYYLQANSSRDQVYLKSARAHAGALRISLGSLVLKVREVTVGPVASVREAELPFPCDVPPRSQVSLRIPRELVSDESPPGPIEIVPHFHRGRAHVVAPPEAEIQLVVEHGRTH
jgi:hypothetical protein